MDFKTILFYSKIYMCLMRVSTTYHRICWQENIIEDFGLARPSFKDVSKPDIIRIFDKIQYFYYYSIDLICAWIKELGVGSSIIFSCQHIFRDIYINSDKTFLL